MNTRAREALARTRRRTSADRMEYARWQARKLRDDPDTYRQFVQAAFKITGGVGPVWRLIQTKQAASATVTFTSTATADNFLVAMCMNDANVVPTTPTNWNAGSGTSTSGGTARGLRISWLRAAGTETGATFGGTLTSPKTIFAEYQVEAGGLTGTGNSPQLASASSVTTAAGTTHASTAIAPARTGFTSCLVVVASGLRANTTATWSTETATGTNKLTVTEDLDSGGMVIWSFEVLACDTGNYSGTATSSASLTGCVGQMMFGPAFAPKNTGTVQNPMIL